MTENGQQAGREERGVPPGLGDVSLTLLIPLFCRALETEAKNPIMRDPQSVKIARELGYDTPAMMASLPRRNTDALITVMALRTRRFDQYVREFLARHPDGVVVNIGCGLDTRFSRIDNGRVEWYDLDFPEVIALREAFFPETARYHLIRSSVLDPAWLEALSDTRNRPVLFIAEGVLEYLQGEEVRSLVLRLQDTVPGCELVVEVVGKWIANLMKRPFWRHRMQAKLNLGVGATFAWGIKQSEDLEGWDPKIHFLDDYYYLDPEEKRLGRFRLLGYSAFLRHAQWIVHYRLG